MLSRAGSDSCWTSATLAKRLSFKTCFIRAYKKKSQGARSAEQGVGYHHQFVFSQKLLDAQSCVMVQESIPTLSIFWTFSSQALKQYFQHIQVKLPIYWLPWANLMTSTNLTAALTRRRSFSTNSHHLLQLLWENEGHFWSFPANHGKSRILQQPVSSSTLPLKYVGVISMTHLLFQKFH